MKSATLPKSGWSRCSCCFSWESSPLWERSCNDLSSKEAVMILHIPKPAYILIFLAIRVHNRLKRRTLHKCKRFLLNWKKKLDWAVRKILWGLVFLMFSISSLHIFMYWLSEVKLTVNATESGTQCLTVFWMSDLRRFVKWQWGTNPFHVLAPVVLHCTYFHLANCFYFST